MENWIEEILQTFATCKFYKIARSSILLDQDWIILKNIKPIFLNLLQMLERNGKKWNNLQQQRKYEAVRKRMKFHWKHQDMESNILSKFSFFFPPLECTRECWKTFQSDSKLLRPKVVNFNFHPTPRFHPKIRKEKEKKKKFEAICNKLDLVSIKCHSRAAGI